MAIPTAQGKLAQARAAAELAKQERPRSEQLMRLGAVVAQLVLVIAVAIKYRFESPAFQHFLPWIGVAIVIHHLLPARLRLSFFAALSIGSVGVVLGMRPGGFDYAGALQRGLPLLVIGLGLISICHLPISFRSRVLALLTAGAALIVCRSGIVFEGALETVWPLLGALFMFRLIVYTYDIQHEKTRPQVDRILAYFFMLPNAFFPFFPVVDWRAFSRDYYNDDAFSIYQRGLHWMTRGVLHIIFYRIVYYHFYIDPSQIADGESLFRYVLSNFALYLRVSGQFHMIVGLLLLFGFNLPLTNHHYFLADSFSDYWRRVNIYWKDFMMKIFYTPVAFRLRGRGGVMPVVVGSAAAFLATWLLHAYQSFWLRGGLYFSPQDALFWTILGILVMLNAAWESSRGRQRSLSKKINWAVTAAASVRTMGVFATLCVLWSLWSSKSIGQWLSIWRFADGEFFIYGAVALLLIGATKMTVEATKGLAGGIFYGTIPKNASSQHLLRVAIVTVVVPASIAWVLGDARVHRRVDDKTRFILHSLTSNQPNTSDLRSMERGYYENLFDAASSNFVDSGLQAPPDWIDFPQIDMLRETGDIRFWELIPSRSEKINGYSVSTNAQGMRDKEYTVEKAADAYRIAVLGSSHVMGWGVNDGETFEAIIEEKLGGERSDGKLLEIMNFGVGGYSPICQLGVMRDKALPMSPDAIYYIAHGVDGVLAIERLARLVQKQIPIPDTFLRDIVERAVISPSMSQSAMLRELPPFADEIVLGSYKRIVEMTREAGAVPVWIYIPRVPERQPDRAPIERLIAHAREAGFITYDLSELWGDTAVDDYVMSQWDMHPNAPGHEMIADAITEVMRSDPALGFVREGEP